MAENGTVERASYVAMASAAMEALGNKKGCSRQAILKYMEQHNQVRTTPSVSLAFRARFRRLDGNNKTVNYHLREALKKGLDTGKFKQVSGNGANGSFALVKAKGGENPKKAGKEEQPPKAPAGGKAPRPKEPKAASAAPARPKPGDPPKPKDPPKLKAKAAVPPRPAKPNGTTATKTNASAKAKGIETSPMVPMGPVGRLHLQR
ncbi:unnamed protein product [Darwinula stevensoni]|uniref:H15 domain-containing protein n=1 Tax=Darwinula stevensoni TaxID=69355 RepID=A0A7R8XD14_9CRUS|nr:unnamed protein product [Darwinula stevensoni]CAG0893042.1 unnamed protein product [Darwinula stevensoni]